MLKNYLLITFRNLYRQKVYTLLNIAGLAIGMAAAILLFLYIYDELSYDQSFKDKQLVYRVATFFSVKGRDEHSSRSPGALSPALLNDYPEVEYAVRVLPRGNLLIKHEEKKFNEKKCFFAEKDFFQLFDYHFLQGDPATALKDPYTVVLKKQLAVKIFGNIEGALGKNIILEISGKEKNFRVSGIIEEEGERTHLEFECILSFESLFSEAKKDSGLNNFINNWGGINFFNYIKIKADTDPIAFEEKLKEDIFPKYMEKDFGSIGVSGHFILQPITEIRLYSDFGEDIAITNTIRYVYAFGLVALFILLIASINYMNLATARSVGRAREVGIRKVLGAYRAQLITQFLTESILLTLISGIISLSLVELLLPVFNQIAGKTLEINYLSNPMLWVSILLLNLLVGLLCGSYPAFFLSNFKPVKVLKGRLSNQKETAMLRKGLVIVQFTISTMMIAGTWIIYQQLNYIQSKDLGFDQSQVFCIDLYGSTRQKTDLMKELLLKTPGVESVAFSNYTLGKTMNTQGLRIELESGEKSDDFIKIFFIDDSYLKLLDIPLVQGRNFNREMSGDTMSVIVNEAFAKKMGYKENPLGKKIIDLGLVDSFENVDQAPALKIIGVVENFHTESLHQMIQPVAMFLSTKDDYKQARNALIRLEPGFKESTLSAIQEVYEKIDNTHPMESYFLDQNFAIQYETDTKRGQVFLFFSILTIIIACLGLFGLASFTAEQKTKEIGIRKVLGADITSILILLSRQFLFLVLLSNLLAMPIAWYMMGYWLETFAYHIDLLENWFIFLATFLLTMSIAVMTIGSQALNAATTNPVNVLKNE